MFRLLKFAVRLPVKSKNIPQFPRFQIQSCFSSFAVPKGQDRKSVEWRENLLRSVKTNDYNSAEKIYWQIRDEEESLLSQSRAPVIHRMYGLFLTLCNKKTHLPHVNHILQFFEKHNFPITEQCYFALIKCYSDTGEDQKIIDLIQKMKDTNLGLRYRNFQPLFTVYLRKKSIPGFIHALNLLKENEFTLKSSELTLLFKAIDVERRISCHDYLRNYELKQQLATINEILRKISDSLLGMDSSDMIEVVQQFTERTSEQLMTDGILVGSKEDVPGPISLKDRYEEDGSFIALNASYNHQSELLDSLPHSAVTPGNEFLTFFRTRYIDSRKKEEILIRRGELLPPLPLARLVHIANNNSHCPNCKEELSKLYISDEQRRLIREELYAVGSRRDIGQIKSFEAFETWLADKNFDVIIDGANVAYNNQNYQVGRFSYKQIDIIVQKVLSLGKKPLVVLPQCYAKPGRIIPNSIKGRTVITDVERGFITRLARADMLYSVPERLNDDWFWILASIHSKANKLIYVITNDQMRDHRDRFLESLAFHRWRTAHVVYFTINRIWSNATSNTSFSDSSKYRDNLPSIFNSEDMSIGGEAHLFFPGEENSCFFLSAFMFSLSSANCSRAIQYSEKGGRWHLPSIDSDVWLCADLNPFQTVTVKQ